MSDHDVTKILAQRTTTTDRRARREDRRKRNILRKAVETNELRFALHELATLRRFERAVV